MIKEGILPKDSENLFSQCPRKELVYCAHHYVSCEYMLLIYKYVLEEGYIPIVPFLVNPPSILHSIGFTHSDFLQHDLQVLNRCDRLWVFGHHTNGGVAIEKEWWKNNKNSIIEYVELKDLIKEE